jgi:cysteinyl-tRNA synthetase
VLRLMDTRTRRVEEIVPAHAGRLTVYACGPTVYRHAHVGNLRTFLLSDLIRRTAQWHGLQVHLVQNITDVGHMTDDSAIDPTGEDKILAQARAEQKDPFAIARYYEEQFHTDQAALGVLPADDYPRASECIDIMLDLVRTLVDKGHAYVGEDSSVYFDARSFPRYGEISGNRLDALRPGHRIDAEEAMSNKRFHADWALWKHAGPDRTEMVWDSPWGLGFPGWHLECSAMSLTYLGDVIDIHTGGIDLRFPHHEDEKAQSDCAVGHSVVRHWVHGEHLLFDGRKMAKSSGNVVLVSDVVAAGFDPLALRLAFLQTRYRQQANLTWEAIAAAERTLTRWRSRVAEWAPENPAAAGPTCAEYVERVVAAFDDDLDTPAAVVIMRELERDPSIPPAAKYRAFTELDALFGLDLGRDVGRTPEDIPLPAGAEQLLAERAAARQAKDWSRSDVLRDELRALGVAVTDTREGQTWELTDQPGPVNAST